MMHPMTINPSYLLITLDNTCGISKDPGTFKILIEVTPLDFKSLTALSNNFFVIFLL